MGKLLDNGTCMRLQTDNREMQQIACWQSKLRLTSETLSHSLHATSAVVFRAAVPVVFWRPRKQNRLVSTVDVQRDTL